MAWPLMRLNDISRNSSLANLPIQQPISSPTHWVPNRELLVVGLSKIPILLYNRGHQSTNNTSTYINQFYITYFMGVTGVFRGSGYWLRELAVVRTRAHSFTLISLNEPILIRVGTPNMIS